MPVLTLAKKRDFAVIHLDDGRVNAIQDQFLLELNRALDKCEADDSVQCVVLAGRPGVFSAGLDLKVLPGLPPEQLKQTLLNFGSTVVRLFNFPKPTIAEVTGHAIAGGAVLTLCCDLRLAAGGEFKWGLTEVVLGIAIPWFIALIADESLPIQSRTPVLLHGVTLTPLEAHQSGIFHGVFPGDTLEMESERRAEALAKVSPTAYRETKRRLRGSNYLSTYPAEIDHFVSSIQVQGS